MVICCSVYKHACVRACVKHSNLVCRPLYVWVHCIRARVCAFVGACVHAWRISTINLAACVCVCAKFDQFLPGRSHFDSKRPEKFVRIATFPSATFGRLFAFHCPVFFTKNNNLEWKSSRFATRDVLKTVTMTSA